MEPLGRGVVEPRGIVIMVSDDDVMVDDYELLVDDDGVMVDDHEPVVDDDDVMVNDHQVMDDDDGAMVDDHEPMVANHGVIVIDHELEVDHHGAMVANHEPNAELHAIVLDGHGSQPGGDAIVKSSDNARLTKTHLKPPPPEVVVPKPPADFLAGATGNNRGSAPLGAELAALPDAVRELAALGEYTAVFGKTAPPQAHVFEGLAAAAAWSTFLSDVDELRRYGRIEAAGAWKSARPLIEAMKRPWEAACAQDATLATACPALTRLLGAASVRARKSAATKKRKRSDGGEPPAG